MGVMVNFTRWLYGRELHFEGGQIGAIFATMGIASLVMPGIIGIIADKWFNAELYTDFATL